MQVQQRARQRGISFFGLVVVVAALVFLGVLGAQVFPTVIEYQAIAKAAQKASDGNTVAEVRQIFDKAAEIDDIKSITGKDLDISKDGDRVVVGFAYNKEIHMFGPAFLLIKYAGKSK
ncbi:MULTISPECIES: DUF4845 domain-containing protein [Ramlibacter]|uniref:DUF4845 domain-containing protein n=1 Tax=Ramlibacter aquaticus TaxID=2780094 RepID=A0ABR9SI57_9BURK|nr:MULTISPECIES: DUF4845 domain-containing protein [Ramlibacter]MBE7941960.1 DUF4845 domain-containing protein [Ramlibacter aquaticus]